MSLNCLLYLWGGLRMKYIRHVLDSPELLSWLMYMMYGIRDPALRWQRQTSGASGPRASDSHQNTNTSASLCRMHWQIPTVSHADTLVYRYTCASKWTSLVLVWLVWEVIIIITSWTRVIIIANCCNYTFSKIDCTLVLEVRVIIIAVLIDCSSS